MSESALASLKRTYWTSNGAGRKYFTEQTLVNAISFLKNTCFVTLLVTDDTISRASDLFSRMIA